MTSHFNSLETQSFWNQKKRNRRSGVQPCQNQNCLCPNALMVKKVVRRAEVKGHRHGFRVSGVLLIEAADNPRPVHKLCH